jgi:regulator of protease activity HflC (stomatin/prohibitin superfamily)
VDTASALLLVLWLPLAAACGLRRVPAGCAVALHRGRRFRRTLGAGWHWVWPLLERLGPPVALLGHRIDAAAGGGARPCAEVYFQILEPGRTGDQLERVDSLVGQQAACILAAMSGDLRLDPVRLAGGLKAQLNSALNDAGLYVIRCQLR